MTNSLLGEVILWPASPFLPADFLPCDGRLVSTTQYSDLFGALAYSYGGSGSQFGLPRLTAPKPTNGAAPLTYLVAARGLQGDNRSFGSTGAFVGEVRLLAGATSSSNIPGAAVANGAFLSVNQNAVLYSLFSVRFGGDGRVNFALPNMTPLAADNGPTVTPFVVTAGYYPSPDSNVLGENLIAEIRLTANRFAPSGWALLNQANRFPVSSYNALYALLGNSFGGDNSQFSLPQLTAVPNAGNSALDSVQYELGIAGIFPQRSDGDV